MTKARRVHLGRGPNQWKWASNVSTELTCTGAPAGAVERVAEYSKLAIALIIEAILVKRGSMGDKPASLVTCQNSLVYILIVPKLCC